MTPRPLLCFIVGARPNFVKAAPVLAAVADRGAADTLLVHTGQHYDPKLSDLFFRDLDMPRPDLHLEVGSGSHAQQTGEVMKRLEPVLAERRPAAVVVFGDVNSTVAASLTAAKLGIPVVHVEAGLRSFDRSMPEEINRQVTDCLSDLLFTTEESGNENLAREGVSADRVHFVGNTMVDSLVRGLPRARGLAGEVFPRYGIENGGYAVVTLHRPSNVDRPDRLAELIGLLETVSRELPVIFPVHPRTRGRIESHARTRDGGAESPRLIYSEPLGYLEFLCLVDGARLVLTDSGGIQEETTALGVPCLTLRENTERPVTLSLGTNRLVGSRPAEVLRAATEVLATPLDRDAVEPPPLWDGRAAERLAAVLADRFPA